MNGIDEKLAAWEARITQEPKSEVANLDYIELLVECRILEDAGAE